MKTTTINISDMNLDGKEFVVNFNATYHLPIEWLAEKDIIKVDAQNKFNVNRLVIEYFHGQMFSDAFGKIPAEHYTLTSVNGFDNIQKEINHRIVLAVAEQKKKEDEEEKILAEKRKVEKKDRIKALKKELAELEKSVG
jgi:hypothetical protein